MCWCLRQSWVTKESLLPKSREKMLSWVCLGLRRGAAVPGFWCFIVTGSDLTLFILPQKRKRCNGKETGLGVKSPVHLYGSEPQLLTSEIKNLNWVLSKVSASSLYWSDSQLWMHIGLTWVSFKKYQHLRCTPSQVNQNLLGRIIQTLVFKKPTQVILACIHGL